MMVRGDVQPDCGGWVLPNSLEWLARQRPYESARYVLSLPVMMKYAGDDLHSQPLEADGRYAGAGPPHWDGFGRATRRAVSATCEYPHSSEQEPNLNDISSVSGSESSPWIGDSHDRPDRSSAPQSRTQPAVAFRCRDGGWPVGSGVQVRRSPHKRAGSACVCSLGGKRPGGA